MPEDQSVNPYAAPATFGHDKMTFAGFEVLGKKLAVQDGAVLPSRCIKTNREISPGENGRPKLIKLAWSNPWWALLILVPYGGLLIYIVVSLATRKSGSITVHLSNQAIKRKRIWLGSLTVLAFGIPAILFNMDLEITAIIGFAILGSVILLLIALFTARYLTPVKYQEGWFIIRGINREFLDEIAAQNPARPPC